MQRKEIQRGDLFYYDFGKRVGSVQSGERPVMVIQADNFNANYVVRRLDPFAKSKDHCDKCNNSGWDYIVYDKRTSIKGKGCRNV